MGEFSCVVQEDSAASSLTEELESQLTTLHKRHYPDQDVTFSWSEVVDGFMYTEGNDSTSSIIACVMDWDTTLAHREEYMRGVCDIWTEVTGCTDHEVVVAIMPTNPL